MNERNAVSVTSRERLRLEIAAQTEQFLREGGHIEQVHLGRPDASRPVGPVWWETRASSPLALVN